MITPYLIVDRAAEAIEFYKRAFGLVECCRIPAPDGRLLHAALDLPGVDGGLYLSDEFSASNECQSPRSLDGTSVRLHFISPDVDAAFARAIDAGAEAVLPPTDMPWGDRYCKVTDPFGHQWSIATHLKENSPGTTGA